MKFDLGDRVIYPHHGAALITAREKRKAFGEEREYLVLETAHGDLTLSVPADMADSVGMRPPIDEDDVEEISVSANVAGYSLPLGASNHPSTLQSRGDFTARMYGGERVRNLKLRRMKNPK